MKQLAKQRKERKVIGNLPSKGMERSAVVPWSNGEIWNEERAFRPSKTKERKKTHRDNVWIFRVLAVGNMTTKYPFRNRG
jgi:hypothetical protein